MKDEVLVGYPSCRSWVLTERKSDYCRYSGNFQPNGVPLGEKNGKREMLTEVLAEQPNDWNYEWSERKIDCCRYFGGHRIAHG